MEKTKLSSKGQIILPKPLRDAKQWKPGTEFTVELVREGVLLKPVRPFPPTKIEDLYGSLEYTGPAKTIEEMDEGIAREVARRHARGRY